MLVQILPGHKATPREASFTWEELVAFLTKTPIVLPERVRVSKTADDLPAWIPAHLREGKRGDDNVEYLSALVLDFDNQKIVQWREALRKLEEAGVQYIYHSTRKHAPVDGKLRYRVVIRLSRNVLVHEWREFWGAAAPYFEASQNDKSCKDPTRLYYQPVQIQDGP